MTKFAMIISPYYIYMHVLFPYSRCFLAYLTNVFVWFQVLGVSFSPNGYHLASGGEDNSCRIWDLRKRKSLYIIPAHSNLLSQVKFEPQEGYFLVTGSYDTTAKVFLAFFIALLS